MQKAERACRTCTWLVAPDDRGTIVFRRVLRHGRVHDASLFARIGHCIQASGFFARIKHALVLRRVLGRVESLGVGTGLGRREISGHGPVSEAHVRGTVENTWTPRFPGNFPGRPGQRESGQPDSSRVWYERTMDWMQRLEPGAAA